MDYKKAYEDSLSRAKELWEIYKGERHIIEFILPEVCYLKDKEERLKGMTQEEKIKHFQVWLEEVEQYFNNEEDEESARIIAGVKSMFEAIFDL